MDVRFSKIKMLEGDRSLLPLVPTYDNDGNATLVQTSTGTAMRDKKTCCYYLGNPLVEVRVSGFYNDEESRKHEQYHFDVWVNSFIAFELVAKALLFRDKTCIGNYLNILGQCMSALFWRIPVLIWLHIKMTPRVESMQGGITIHRGMYRRKKSC